MRKLIIAALAVGFLVTPTGQAPHGHPVHREAARGAALDRPSTRSTPPPYDWATIDSYVRNAAAQTTLLRTNRALVIIALAAGAGLRASEIRTFAGRDLDEGHVAVGGNRPRVVPVNDRMLHVLLDGIGTEAGPVFTDHKNALNSVTQSLMFDPVLPRMGLRRLRNTWISSRLEELSVIELMTQSGLTSVRVIDDLVRMRNWGME